VASNEKKPIFTLTVFAGEHEGHASTLAHVAYACETAGRDARAAGGGKTSGIILGAGAVEIGSWEYSPTAGPG
jgi:hypothetical protein